MTQNWALTAAIFILGILMGYVVRGLVAEIHAKAQRDPDLFGMDVQQHPGMDRHRILDDFFKGMK